MFILREPQKICLSDVCDFRSVQESTIVNYIVYEYLVILFLIHQIVKKEKVTSLQTKSVVTLGLQGVTNVILVIVVDVVNTVVRTQIEDVFSAIVIGNVHMLLIGQDLGRRI